MRKSWGYKYLYRCLYSKLEHYRLSAGALFRRCRAGRTWKHRRVPNAREEKRLHEQGQADGITGWGGRGQVTVAARMRQERPRTASPNARERQAGRPHAWNDCAAHRMTAADALPTGRQGEMAWERFLHLFSWKMGVLRDGRKAPSPPMARSGGTGKLNSPMAAQQDAQDPAQLFAGSLRDS